MTQTLLQILVLGPEASGKSTMTRHLLREGGDSWKSLEKPQKETGVGDYTGKSPPTRARGLDRPRAEQQQGAAPSHLLQHFKTPKYEVIVVDSLEPGGLPGNPFPGSAPAGAAVLLVPAAGGQREAGCAVTCQQVLLACNLPAKQLVVCVNKMDATQPPYSRQRYQEITQAVCACLRQLGKNPATVAFLPISGLHGDNLLGPSSRMPWFRGWAGTRKRGGTMATSLQQVLDSLVPGRPQRDSDYTRGVWSEAEMRSLLSVWKGIAGRVAHGVPLARDMSLELMGAGVRRSPQQCRVKANAMMKQYFHRQIGAGRGRCPFYQELHTILGGEVTKLMYDLEHPCECSAGSTDLDSAGSTDLDSAGSTDLDSAGSLTEEESDSGEAEDQEMFLAGLEGDPVRMSSTPVPCLEVPPALPASPDGTTSAGRKRKDPERPVLRLPKKPRGETLHAGTQPPAPSRGSHPKGDIPPETHQHPENGSHHPPPLPHSCGLGAFRVRAGDGETAPLNSANFTASLGPGLDSDFGASAGISLRVVSSASEEGAGMAGGCPQASGGLEWDYCDPSYKRRHARLCRPPKLPLTCSKQYWL
ncbi:prickle-like protein 1 [Platysternon megacephalum]|uniref:Prickle-like protein 1 n=1 Tax=Platysternon megacephalum TaxID=55544 RepID=A0A4D9EFE5_9SAUR|nr:prickle-like protein 1 [Platysternon megacephalum]